MTATPGPSERNPFHWRVHAGRVLEAALNRALALDPDTRAGDQAAMSEEAKRGWQLFQDLKCTDCHDGVLLTDQQYHNVGIGMDQPTPDGGRANFTKKPEDTGAFKTPTLRDVAKSAPYFHDGSAKTLEEAVDIMLAGGKPNQYLDKKNLQPQRVLPEQREDLLNFLRSLSVDCTLKKPPLPQN